MHIDDFIRAVARLELRRMECMVPVYEPGAAEGFEFCHPVRQEDFETLCTTIDGTPRAWTWRSPAMHLIHADEGQTLLESDSPWLGAHALIFRRRAALALEPILSGCGELLPLACAEADLVVFNVTQILDALDEAASELTRFSSGRVMLVKRPVFRPEVIAGVDAFKLSSLRVSPTYVSQRVVEQVRSSGLRGLTFRRVWPD